MHVVPIYKGQITSVLSDIKKEELSFENIKSKYFRLLHTNVKNCH